jgi:5-methylthioadenosine/S-adenosylhomocysteine deaminase
LILLNLETTHVQPINDVFSQVVHCAKASDVQTVIVNGEILMKDRQLIRHDKTKLLADARQANRDLMERVNTLTF